MRSIFRIFCFYICTAPLLFAANTRANDFQTWFNLTTMGHFSFKNKVINNWGYWLEIQERFGDNSSTRTQNLLRPGLGYYLNPNWSLWLGYAFVNTGVPIFIRNFDEHRIWQQLLWIKTTPQWILMSRSRLEERLIEGNSYVALRYRQLAKASIPLKINSLFSWVISDEIFIRKNNALYNHRIDFDQNRFFTGFGYRPNKMFLTEIGFMNQYIKRIGLPNFNANILSLNGYLFF